MIVVDASAVIEVLLNTPIASRVAERLFHANETLHAPHLLDVEMPPTLLWRTRWLRRCSRAMQNWPRPQGIALESNSRERRLATGIAHQGLGP